MSSLGISVSGLYRQADPIDKVGTSALGTPVKSNIKFKELTYESRDGTEEELKDPNVEGEHFARLDTVVFQVNKKKHIKRTRVPGADGEVHEYISDGLYEVTISGKLVQDNEERRPEGQMQKLHDLDRAEVPLDITCPFLSIFGIYRIVVDNVRVEEEKGFANMVAFQINATEERTPVADINDIQPASVESIPSF